MDAATGITTVQTLQSALSVLTALQITSFEYPATASFDIDLKFDYVVVGGGTAGSVMAARLSENPQVTVALIEAGGDPPLEAELPGLFALEPKMTYDYDFLAENDNLTNQHTLDKAARLTAGKLLGGTTSMMHAPYLRGNPLDFNRWAEAAGDDSWNYDNLLKYFIKLERLEDRDILHSNTGGLHGTKGPVGLTREPNELNNNYFKSMDEIGLKYALDISGNSTRGVTDPLLMISGGRKQHTAKTYLSPAKDRQNLYVYKSTVVTKIIFDDNNTATGVEALTSDNETVTFQVNKEVIISAGAIRSPQLLMLSGVGPQDQLEKFNISVVSDLPVGQTLRDRVAVPLAYKMQASNVTIPASNYFKFPNPVTVGFKALNESQSQPDFQVITLVFPHDQSTGLSMISSFVFKYENAITDAIIDANTGHELFMAFIGNGHPQSTGQLLLKSTDPLEQPEINLGLFSTASDIDDMGAYLEYFAQIGETSHFKNVSAELVEFDLPECNNYTTGSSDYWKCYATSMSVTFWQYMSTCSLGSVVDSELKVKGVQNLRVVDASVLPYFTSGEPVPAIIAVAEKAADLIRRRK
ncbi:ecdysone oxidase-like [Ostrinia nubilalis]|uniref:ecdysone oxidase-like n=1 Tax=Ostrinia nubilalis TaxID=29057 RepID=UPI003082251B